MINEYYIVHILHVFAHVLSICAERFYARGIFFAHMHSLKYAYLMHLLCLFVQKESISMHISALIMLTDASWHILCIS